MEVIAGDDKELVVALADDECVGEAADEYTAQAAMDSRTQLRSLGHGVCRGFGGVKKLFREFGLLGRIPDGCISGFGFCRGGPHHPAAPALDHRAC